MSSVYYFAEAGLGPQGQWDRVGPSPLLLNEPDLPWPLQLRAAHRGGFLQLRLSLQALEMLMARI